MFVTGNLYHYAKGCPVAECLFVDKESVILRYVGNRHLVAGTPTSMTHEWKEYTEPQIKKAVRYVGLNDKGEIYTDESYVGNIIGSFEITVTDGEFIKVENLNEL